jgi:hypothetical protein
MRFMAESRQSNAPPSAQFEPHLSYSISQVFPITIVPDKHISMLPSFLVG